MNNIKKPTDFKKDILYKMQSKNPSNKKCADCDQYGTIYIDILYGCFLCQTCAGIHRALGTDISRIKSISFDKFANDDIKFIEKIGGNNKFNKYYEHKCKDKNNNMNNNELKTFILLKYQFKKYIGELTSPEIINKDVILIDLF